MLSLIVVDDHPLVRQGLRSVLSLENDLVFAGEASCNKDAVTLIRTVNPDLVLLDIRLSGESGFDLIEYCNKAGIPCKFLVLTSSADERDFRYAKELGAHGYILKEALPEDLLYAIHLVGRGKNYYDPKIMDEIMKDPMHSAESEELTERELEVLGALGDGLCNKEIADRLFISIFTVKKHVSQILAKLDLADRTQAALYAQANYLSNSPALYLGKVNERAAGSGPAGSSA
ncbi:MAG: response regulator [Saccharofermentanales bacterium]